MHNKNCHSLPKYNHSSLMASLYLNEISQDVYGGCPHVDVTPVVFMATTTSPSMRMAMR